MSMTCLSTKQRGEWQEVLNQTRQHDWYHLADTHSLAERKGEGTGHLFAYREGPYLIAIPLLLRSLDGVPGLGSGGAGWNDATSVYGYAGPVASHETMPETVIQHFQAGLCELLRELRVVTVFSRLNPLIAQCQLLEGLGEVVPTGQTISIDLSLPVDVQFRQFDKGHRQDIRKARGLGIVCVEDKEKVYLKDLIDLYNESMRRLKAAEYYYFDAAYFEALFNISGCDAHLFAVLRDDRVIHANLVMVCKGIVQGHLSGTSGSASHLAPMKLSIDTVRQWAVSAGHKVYHFGGGVGGRADSLFHFKAGFSSSRNNFFTWRYVVEPRRYRELSKARTIHALESGLAPATDDFFPAYRAPVVPVAVSQ
jgi:hypothetical protein